MKDTESAIKTLNYNILRRHSTFSMLQKIILLILIIFHISVYNSLAQQDSLFWFVAPDVAASHGDSPIYLRVSTLSNPSSVTVSMPSRPAFTPMSINIPANNVGTIDLTPFKSIIENAPPDVVNDNGLKITSTSIVTAYYEVAHANNPDIFPLKGKNGLGMDFFIPSQFHYPNQVGQESFEIVATENGTIVTIYVTDNVNGHTAGSTWTVNLKKGQTYSVRSTNTTPSATLAGSRVTSNKPIAISIMDDSLRPQITTGGYDLVGDQILPVNLLGIEYIVVKGFAYDASNNFERLYILAPHDNTNIYINGSVTPAATLNSGQSHSILMALNAYYITTDFPVYVYHISGHFNELGSAVIPHITCTGSQQVGFIRSTSLDFALMLLTKNDYKSGFLVNGNATTILGSDFTSVPGTAGVWVYARKELNSTAQLPSGPNIIENTLGPFHMGILNKLGGSSEYGYFSDYSSLYLGPDISYCFGKSITLDAGAGYSSYLWNNGTTSQTLITSDTGTYYVTVQDGLCILSDTLHLAYYPIPSVEIGSDSSICQGESITYDAGAGFSAYLWHNGSTLQTHTTSTTGTKWVKVNDDNDCEATDTLELTVHPVPSVLSIKHN